MAEKRGSNSRKAQQPRRAPARGPGRADSSPASPGTRPHDDGHSEFELNDVQVERALQTGEQAGLLEDYFGSEEYAELRQLSRDVATRGVRGGPKVLILPGIMGSKIGRDRPGSLFDDVYWFDPVDVALGRLEDLALERPGEQFTAVGVMLMAYLKLKLRLRAAGYDAEFHAFDWRRGIDQEGRALVDVLKRAGGDQVAVVAHSMGGLVARWALAHGGKCRRLIMLGTPNYGSFAPVMALRGTYPIVRRVAELDRRHTAEELARDVFSTFPGLTQMLPSPERWHDVDLYDLENWPEPDGLRPRAAILAGVQAVQSKLARGDDRFTLIAGVDRRTVVGLQRDPAHGFVYEYSNAGDGTVPLDLARLPDVPTYYVAESHGSLANNALVARAVLDLLDRGETDALPRTYAAEERRSGTHSVPEAELRVNPYAGRGGIGGADAVLLSQRELRAVLEDVAAPSSSDDLMTVPSGAHPSVGGDAIDPGYRHPFDRVVVGRRRQQRLEIRFALGSITEADSRAVALGVFRDVTPSGAANALDRRLGGAITELSRRRMYSGQVGEIFMLPTGRHPVAADLVALVGLGPFDRFNEEVLQLAAENLIRTFVNTRVEEFATVLLGAGSGGRAASALRNLLAGFIRGLCDADRDHHFRRIVLCEQDPQRYTEIKQELYRLSSTALCKDVELTFDEVTLPAPLNVAAVPRRLQARSDPTYLIVRQEQSRNGGREVDIRSSVLTSGAKATVVTGVRTVSMRAYDQLRRRLTDVNNDDNAKLEADGIALAELLLDETVRTVLPRQRESHLVVVHDAQMSRAPWETMGIAAANGGGKAWFPAAEQGLSHRYAAENLSVAKWLEERLQDDILHVLLVANPTADLEGAELEAKRVQELFKRVAGCRLDVLHQKAASRPALLAAFSSGKYDVVHYAGHAFFDEANPERSGLYCAGNAVLTGADVAGLAKLPTLVFFNACEAARVRGRAAGRAGAAAKTAKAAKVTKTAAQDRIEKSVGVAEALMRGGVANFLGTYWPVGDAAATEFADAFYRGLLGGQPISQAVQAGRGAVKKTGSKDWADYVFYGNPDFVLKEATGAST